MNKQLVTLGLVFLLASCGGGNDSSEESTGTDSDEVTSTEDETNGEGNSSDDVTVDITDAIFTNKVANCAEYANQYSSSVKDIGEDVLFDGSLSISVTDDKCSFITNAIPNHNFNDGQASFVTNVAENMASYSMTQTPADAGNTTSLTLETDNGLFLNGVKLDLLAAACYGVGSEPLGHEKIGCNDSNQPFRYDPMYEQNDFGTDSHHAHTQPDGTYHYHGSPNAMFYSDTAIESPVIGFAADGFPIYGSYFNDNGTIRKATSSYQLKSGTRQSVDYNGVTYAPGGSYDGTFIDDYEYVEGLGDLDECNGMTVDGIYGYYVTETYPWVLKCFKGTPDTSFNKR